MQCGETLPVVPWGAGGDGSCRSVVQGWCAAVGSGQGDLSSGNRSKFVGLNFNVIGSELLLVIFSQKVSTFLFFCLDP